MPLRALALVFSAFVDAYRIGRPPLSVRHPHSLNIFSSETAAPIKVKFHMEPSRSGGTKVSSNGRRTYKMRICVFHSNLNVKNPIIFGNVRTMYAKHFPDTQLCPVSKRICFVYIFNGVWTASIFLKFASKTCLLADKWDSKPIQIIKAW